jgi:hypothetical protein
MSQHRKHRGYKTQKLVADYFKANGWEYAESAGAGRQGSDVTGIPYDVEVKARSKLDLAGLMAQLKDRRVLKLGFGVCRLNGQGEKSVGDFVALMRFEDLINILVQLEMYEGKRK